MMKQKSIKINAVLNCIRIMMTLLFPLISFPYASRVLGPEGIGKVDFSISIVSYFVLLASLGINTYGIREAAKVRDNRERLSCLVHEIFLINLITTVLSYGIFIIAIFKVKFFESYIDLLLVSSLNIAFTTLGIEWLYSALEEYAYITIRSILFQVISLILLFGFVKDNTDYLEYATIQVFSVVGSNIFNLVHSRKYVTWKKIKTQSYHFIRHIKPILVIFGLNIASTIYMNLDKTMLGIMSGDKEVGLYTAAMKFSRIVLQLILATGTVMVGRLSYYYSSGLKEEFQKLLDKVFHLITILALPASIGLMLLSEPILILFSGEKYIGATTMMRILSLLIPIVGISNLIAVQVFIPSGKEIFALLSSLGAAFMNLILNSILIPQYGGIGAAISTIVAELVALIMCFIFSKKMLNLRKILGWGIKSFVISLIFIPIYVINKKFIQATIVLLLITIIEAVMIYFGALVLLGDGIIKEGCSDIIRILKGRLKCQK